MDKICGFVRLAILAIAAMLALPVFAAEEAATPGTYVEVQLGYQQSANRGEQQSLTTKLLYVERELVSIDGVSLYATLYHDEEFRSAVAGVAKKFGDLQLALGLGASRYDKKTYPTGSAWVFYNNEDVGLEGLAIAEYYKGDHEAPWFVKGYLHTSFSQYFVGVYGDTEIGIGPMLGVRLDNWKVWGTVPVAGRPDEGRMRAMFVVSYHF